MACSRTDFRAPACSLSIGPSIVTSPVVRSMTRSSGFGEDIQWFNALALALVENRTVLFLVSNRLLQKFRRRPGSPAFGPRNHVQKPACRPGVSLRRRFEHGSNDGLHRRHL